MRKAATSPRQDRYRTALDGLQPAAGRSGGAGLDDSGGGLAGLVGAFGRRAQSVSCAASTPDSVVRWDVLKGGLPVAGNPLDLQLRLDN